MRGIEATLGDIRSLDAMALRDTAANRVDPRAKLVTTAVFLACVLSFERHEVSSLLPFLLYPVALASVGGVPLRYVVRKAAFVSPVALLLALPNLFLERSPSFAVGQLVLSAGFLSFASVLVRFALTVGTAIVLVGVTSFEGLCVGLRRLGVPEVMVVQLLLLYRYIFVLADEASRVVRARALRSFGRRGSDARTFAAIIGHMLLRTMDRASRIHAAMAARGFTGEIHLMRRLDFRRSDLAFTLFWSAAFVVMRAWDLPSMLGDLLRGVVG